MKVGAEIKQPNQERSRRNATDWSILPSHLVDIQEC
jgi:hypothetical protein